MAVVFTNQQNRLKWPHGESCRISTRDIESMQSLLPDAVLLLASPVKNCLHEIHAEERDIVANAVTRRQAEFATGRVLASRALAELDIPPAPVLQGSMNEPVWPEGVTGSITHTTDYCMVAVTTSDCLAGLGIDLEARPAEFEDLEHLILRPDERQSNGGGTLPAAARTRLAFSAKESIYKAIFPSLGRFVDFQEVRITVDARTSCYTASAPDDADLNSLVSRGIGRFQMTKDTVFTIWSYN